MSAGAVESARFKKAQELGQRIRESVDGEAIELPLSTSQRIIARVTDGIYREPWAAFRELCANAYDADATRVVIETGAPEFDQITIRDDGAGMLVRPIMVVGTNTVRLLVESKTNLEVRVLKA